MKQIQRNSVLSFNSISTNHVTFYQQRSGIITYGIPVHSESIAMRFGFR